VVVRESIGEHRPLVAAWVVNLESRCLEHGQAPTYEAMVINSSEVRIIIVEAAKSEYIT
jgi:hypothetical protein